MLTVVLPALDPMHCPMLATDVPLLLKYALDDNVSSVMFAAAAGLYYNYWYCQELVYIIYLLHAGIYSWRNTCSVTLDVFCRI